MKKAVILILAVIAIVFSVLFFQKSGSGEKIPQHKTVVTTIYPLYFITKKIAGDSLEVKRLIKPGSEIHSFSPTPADMVSLDRADLLVTLGRDLEPWSAKLASATDVKTVSMEKGLTLIHAGEHHAEDHDDASDHHSGINPHVWLDFDNDIKMVQMITDRLSRLYPKEQETFRNNAALLEKSFRKLQESYSDGLKSCKQKTLLVGHDAFGYLEREYGFQTESIMGIFAHSKPNAAKLASLSDLIKAKNLHYLFTDPLESSKSASQLASDMNLTLEPLYTLGNISLENEKKGEDMITLLYFDLAQLRKGLECH